MHIENRISCRKLFFNDCGIKVHNVSKSFGSEINEVVRDAGGE